MRNKKFRYPLWHSEVALPGREAFNIEYWALEEAKLQRMPPPMELSRRVCLIVGGGNGIGRAAVLKAAALGAHLVIADVDEAAATEAAEEAARTAGPDGIFRVRGPRSLAAAKNGSRKWTVQRSGSQREPGSCWRTSR